MTDHMKIDHEVGKRITAADECALVIAAYARNPASTLLRARLAVLFTRNDRFDDVIALYADIDPSSLDFAEVLVLANAHMSVERPDDTARAAALATVAFERADHGLQRAAALAARGKAQRRLGATDAAEQSLKEALAYDPHNKDACKRLASLHFDTGAPERVLDEMAQLDAQGVGHSRLFAAQTLALAQLGRIDAAREQDGWNRFAYRGTLAPPAGWDRLDAFNAALAAELLNHRGLRYERYGTASRDSWRVDDPMTGRGPRIRELFTHIIGVIDRHVAEFPSEESHPWLRARPGSATLHSGCVVTEHAGYEDWHMHQAGWLSGVYYVHVPAPVLNGTDERGCIEFGLPEDLAGTDCARSFGSKRVRPQPGMVLLFPSHCHHRTYPHGDVDRRICVAFDVLPA
ncbi:2OG-Fe(II) oxygenase family protein [Sphingomonas sp.]|jgi:tetratricopeptide (TPR) repeat protein|uniref:2OG-Fe(II) oxygenase family protein n=1 Tax=Sphingomonas sp. TaxID=28214 RepID=UPI002E13D027|nr:putative 2OG-Fe(II) oxygenase [Sphingomonas sp.]